jgi:hypothetical protein
MSPRVEIHRYGAEELPGRLASSVNQPDTSQRVGTTMSRLPIGNRVPMKIRPIFRSAIRGLRNIRNILGGTRTGRIEWRPNLAWAFVVVNIHLMRAAAELRCDANERLQLRSPTHERSPQAQICLGVAGVNSKLRRNSHLVLSSCTPISAGATTSMAHRPSVRLKATG